jgi:hypothetical protein
VTGFVLLLTRAASLFGFPLSRFWAGAIVTGLVAIDLAVYSGYLVHVGYDWAEGKCEAGKLRDENARLAAVRAETDRQLTFMNAMAEPGILKPW